MKVIKALLAPILSLALGAAALAESAHERELQQILEQRDKALTAASEPIWKRFHAPAEQLLRRATQAGDLDAANRIKAAMSPGAASSSAGSPGSAASTDFTLGDTANEREMKQLIQQRDKALAAASEPILKRFQTSAEQLLQRATLARDVNAANQIRAALTQPGQALSKSGERALRRKLEGTKWMGDGRHWMGELQFHVDNFRWLAATGSAFGMRAYTVTDETTLQFYSDRDWTIKIAPDFSTLTIGSSTFKRK